MAKEEIHHREHAELAPDIVIVAGKYFPVTSKSKLQLRQPTTAISGQHSRQGMFMASGPNIKKEGLRLANLRIYDIAPTILHMLGVPVPEDMDGQVLMEIFRPESEPATRPVAYEEVNERQRIKEKITDLKASRRI